MRQAAAEALGQIKDPLATDVLLARLQDVQEDSDVRQAAAEALGQIKDPLATDVLLARLQDAQDHYSVRQATAQALGQIKDPLATDALMARLQDAQDHYSVRQAAAQALGQIGEAPAITALSACLQDSDEMWRLTLAGLAQTCEDPTDCIILSSDLDGLVPWLDPQSPITPERIAQAAKQLNKPPEEIKQRYAQLAERFCLQLA